MLRDGGAVRRGRHQPADLVQTVAARIDAGDRLTFPAAAALGTPTASTASCLRGIGGGGVVVEPVGEDFDPGRAATVEDVVNDRTSTTATRAESWPTTSALESPGVEPGLKTVLAHGDRAPTGLYSARSGSVALPDHADPGVPVLEPQHLVVAVVQPYQSVRLPVPVLATTHSGRPSGAPVSRVEARQRFRADLVLMAQDDHPRHRGGLYDRVTGADSGVADEVRCAGMVRQRWTHALLMLSVMATMR